MGRPQRLTVDYFPHYIGNGKKMAFIENKYGNDGYATWFKILERLAESDYHYLSLNEEMSIMFLAAKCRVSETVLLSIIDDLCKIKVFNKIAWSDRIIWSENFIESIGDAYDKRNNNPLTFEELSELLNSLGVLKDGFTELKGVIKPQSKVKESKEDIYVNFDHLKMSVKEYEKLINLGYSKDAIDNIVAKVRNYKKNTKYKILYLTVLDWLKTSTPKKEEDEIPEHIQKHLASLTARPNGL